MKGHFLRWVQPAAIGLALLFGAGTAFAQGYSNTAGSLTLPNPLSCGSLGCVSGNVINFIYIIALPLCAIMVLVGGFQIMTSSGDPEKFSKGRKTVLYAA